MAATGTQGSVRTFDGSVHVRFLDTMLASTNGAAVMEDAERGPLYLIPFDDVYFDYLSRTDAMVDHPPVAGWVCGAFPPPAGRGCGDVDPRRARSRPRALGRCAIFDGTKVAIEVVPADGTVV
jgi:hypothetical protein